MRRERGTESSPNRPKTRVRSETSRARQTHTHGYLCNRSSHQYYVLTTRSQSRPLAERRSRAEHHVKRARNEPKHSESQPRARHVPVGPPARMRTRSPHERRANTRYAGEEWAQDVEMIDADVDRMEDDRCVPDENSDPNVVPPVVTPDGHVDTRRRRVYSKKTRPYSKKTHPHVADPAPPADRSGEYLEYLDVGDRTTSCSFCDAPLWELEVQVATDESCDWSRSGGASTGQRRQRWSLGMP